MFGQIHHTTVTRCASAAQAEGAILLSCQQRGREGSHPARVYPVLPLAKWRISWASFALMASRASEFLPRELANDLGPELDKRLALAGPEVARAQASRMGKQIGLAPAHQRRPLVCRLAAILFGRRARKKGARPALITRHCRANWRLEGRPAANQASD